MILKSATIVAAALFLTAGVLQYNDPDPILWMILYGASAIAALMAAARPLPRWVPVTLGLVAALWAVAILPGVVSEMALTWNEEERELGGLVIVACWMAVLARWRAV